jgi:hypothetical protein
MKSAIIILEICCLMFTTKINCQVKTNSYEIDKLLSKKNPEYYSGLKATLSEFQKELISKQLIADGTYKSYVGLLKQISENDKFEFDIAYNLKEKLEGLGDGITKIMPSIESSLLAQNYLNIENSKDFSFNQKISELVNNGQRLNRSMFANLIMVVYDQEDFELLLIKLKICRFIDPKSDFAVTVYVGKPNSE